MAEEKKNTERCRIPQEHFELGSDFIAEAHSPREIAETIKWKKKAFLGSKSLGHDEFSEKIQEHIKILNKALKINADEK